MNIPKERYTLDEVAEYLGIKDHDVRWLIQQGDLPATVIEDYRPTSNSLYVECYVLAKDLEKFISTFKSKLDDKYEQYLDRSDKVSHTFTAMTQKQDQFEVARGLSLELRGKGLDKKQIASEIDCRFPGFTDGEMGKLLGTLEHEDYPALRKRGQRARGKAK